MRWEYNFKVGETRSPFLALGLVLLGMSAFLLLVLLSITTHLRSAFVLLLIPAFGLGCVLRDLIPVLRGRLFRASGQRCEGRIVALELGTPVNGVPPYRLVLSLDVDGARQTARSEWLYLTNLLPESVLGGRYPVYVRRVRNRARFFVEPYAFRDRDWTPPAEEEALREGDERYTAPAPKSKRGKSKLLRTFLPVILLLLLITVVMVPIGIRHLIWGLEERATYFSDKTAEVTAYVRDLSITKENSATFYSYKLCYSYEGANCYQQVKSSVAVKEGDSWQIRIMRDRPSVQVRPRYLSDLSSAALIIGFPLVFDLFLFLFILIYRKTGGSSA